MAIIKPEKALGEAAGTLILVLTVGCNVLMGNAVWGGVSIAAVLMVMIYALGGISGANFNPAVSFSIYLSKAMGGPGDLGADSFVQYCLVQVLAGIVGAVGYQMFFDKSFPLGPAGHFGWVQLALCELLYTFMLCFVVLNTAVAANVKAEKHQYYGLAIGSVIVAGAFGAGAITGGCFNPAVSIGIEVSSGFASSLGWCVFYILFQMLGGALATVLFKVVRPEEFHKEGSELTQKLTSEFLGTFFLVFTASLNILAKSPSGAYSIAAALMSMIYALGGVSGAHFNPAVSFAVFLSDGDPTFTPHMFLWYIITQIAAGVVAALVATRFYHGEELPLGPQGLHGWAEVAIGEVIFTFLLCLVVLTVAVGKTAGSKDMFGLAIGSCVTVGGNAIGAISLGLLNPAVAFGLASTRILVNTCMDSRAFAYALFQMIGALLAAGVFKITHEEDVKQLRGKA